MELQPELVRAILIWCEDNLDGDRFHYASNIHIEEYTRKEIVYHIGRLKEAGYVNVKFYGADDGADYLLTTLSWYGHHFLETMRSETNWKKALEVLGKVGLVALPEFIKHYLPLIAP